MTKVNKYLNRPVDPIAEQLRKARQARGWSLERAEEKTGIVAVVLGSWERGDRHPPIGKLREWAAAFGYRLQVTMPDEVAVSVDATWVEHAVRPPVGELVLCDSAEEAEAYAAAEVEHGAASGVRLHVGGDRRPGVRIGWCPVIPIWLTVLIAVAAILLGIVAGLWLALATALRILAAWLDDDPDEPSDDDPDPDDPEPADDSPSFDEAYWRETERAIEPASEYRGYC